jgi:hypothetical protein
MVDDRIVGWQVLDKAYGVHDQNEPGVVSAAIPGHPTASRSRRW